MDGAHDLGGKQGYGPVVREDDEPPFHEPWEGRVHGINLSSDVGPAFRYSIERMGAIEYLTTSYYEHWLSSMELNGVESGVFTPEELEAAAARIAAGGDVPDAVRPRRGRRRPPPDHAARRAGLRGAAGHGSRRATASPSRGALRPGHCRCPAYLRGAPGVIESVHAPRPILDIYETEGGREVPQAWYTVAFRSSDLWDDPGEDHVVLVDLWETHFEE